jgi:2-hydroxychromene-2-carboxylate isomerase
VPSPTPAFYFDLASPEAYLAAEQALHIFAAAPEPVEWLPILAAELPGHTPPAADAAFREGIAARAAELHLQPMRWPELFPFNSSLAMRVATYAKSIGRTVPFVQAAFRQCYAGGRSLQDEDSVVIAAAACEMHPKAVLQGAGLKSVATQLAEATAQAAKAGVRSAPAVLAGGQIFHGERSLHEAVEHLHAQPRPQANEEPTVLPITTHNPT